MDKIALALFAPVLNFVSCSKMTTHFALNIINRAVLETDNDQVSYHLFLCENIVLECNDTFNSIEIDANLHLPNSVISRTGKPHPIRVHPRRRFYSN
jgi:hypothetical protein